MKSQAVRRGMTVVVIASLLGLSLTLPEPAYAGTNTWNGGTSCSGTWGDIDCWNIVPAAGGIRNNMVFPSDAGPKRTATNAYCFTALSWDRYYLNSITFTGGGYLVNQLKYCPGEQGRLLPWTRLFSDEGGITDSSSQSPHRNEIALNLELDDDKATPIEVMWPGETLVFSGRVSGENVRLEKKGAGTLEFKYPAGTYWDMYSVSRLTILGGTVRVMRGFWQGSPAAPGSPTAVWVYGGGTLTGNEKVGSVMVWSGGAIQGGPTLSTGDLLLFDGSKVRVSLGSEGHSRLQVDGEVTIVSGAELELDVEPDLCLGERYTIISGATDVTGTFSGLGEGDVIEAGGIQFKITYQGGQSGHNVVLRPVLAPQITDQPDDLVACWWYQPDHSKEPDEWRPAWRAGVLHAEGLASPEPTVTWYDAAGSRISADQYDSYYCGSMSSSAYPSVFTGEHQFYAVFTNEQGSATTRTATITGQQAAQVSCWDWPEDQTVSAGDTVTLKTCFVGTPEPAIQWEKKAEDWVKICHWMGPHYVCEYCAPDGGTCQVNRPPRNPWVAIDGANSESCSFTASLEDDGYRFRARAANSCATVYTREATLTVLAAGSGNQAPMVQDLTVSTEEDTSIAFTLAASDADDDPLTYQILAEPEHGTLSGEAPDLVYAPQSDYNGSDEFDYLANDGTADSNTGTVIVTVAAVNDLPVADAGGPYSGDEGTAIALTGASASDVDGDTLTYSWTDDTRMCYFTDPTVAQPLFVCRDEGAGSYQVTLTVGDGGGELVSSQTTVIVNNVAPVVDASPDQSVNEGDTLSLEVASFQDGGPWDGHTASIDWGDGGPAEDGQVFQTGKSGSVSGSHVYGDDGTYTVQVCVSDLDGGSGCDTFDITVANVAPVVAGADQTVEEGDAVSLDLATFTDAGSADTHSATIDWGDGSPAEDGTVTPGAGSGSVSGSHIYADDGTYTIQVCVSDDDDATACDTLAITVANVAPEVWASPTSQTLQYSDRFAPIEFTYRDMEQDHPTPSLSWSDGGDFVTGLPAGLEWTTASCSVNPPTTGCRLLLEGKAKVPAGTYTVRLTVTDDDGAAGYADTMITVKPEDVRIRFHAGNPVAVRADGDSGTFSLQVSVREAYDAAAGLEPQGEPEAYPGDIKLAQVAVELLPVGPGGGVQPSAECSLAVLDSSYDARDVVVCPFDAVPVNTYVVQVTVDGGYYGGAAEDVLTVYDPSQGYASGGGKFEWVEFQWPLPSEDEVHVGFTMEYNRKGTKVKGSLLLTRFDPSGETLLYQVKSNALSGLALGQAGSPAFDWASFSGKCTFLAPEMAAPEGNYQFTAYVEDRGEDPGVDRFWIEVRDKAGELVTAMSLGRPAPDNAQVLTSGDILVPH